MDVNEEIVRAWLETQGFLVRGRIKYQITGSKGGKGYGDIDLVAYELRHGKKVAVDISAWMTEDITLSYVTDPKRTSYYRLFKSSFPEARQAIRKEFGVLNDDQYELWLVVSFLGSKQKSQVETECLKHVNRVIEFPTIMKELVKFIKVNPNPSQETESLQTLRALVLCGIL